MEPRTRLLVMIAAIIFIVLVFAVSIGATLAYAPKGITVDENNNISLNTVIGQPRLIPLDEITVIEMPEGLLTHLIRTNGMSFGKYDYGHYKNTRTGQKMFLYLTGKEQRVCFTYNGSLYVVDDWRE